MMKIGNRMFDVEHDCYIMGMLPQILSQTEENGIIWKKQDSTQKI